MDTELWVTSNNEVDMIGQDFHLNQFLPPLLYCFQNDSLKPFIYGRYQDLTAVLWAKHHVIMAIVRYIVVCLYFIKRPLL